MKILASLLFLLLAPTVLMAGSMRKITGQEGPEKDAAINVNFDVLNRQIGNAVMKTSTQTIQGFKTFDKLAVDYSVRDESVLYGSTETFVTIATDTTNVLMKVYANGMVGIGDNNLITDYLLNHDDHLYIADFLYDSAHPRVYMRTLILREVNDNPELLFGRTLGTHPDGPLAVVTTGTVLGSIKWQGWAENGAQGGAADGFSPTSSEITSRAREYHTTTKAGADISFYTTPNGSNGRVERLNISTAGYVGIGTYPASEELDIVGEVRISTHGLAGVSLRLAGAFDTLPTSGYHEGTLAYQTSNNTLYCSTEAVTSANSWKALW